MTGAATVDPNGAVVRVKRVLGALGSSRWVRERSTPDRLRALQLLTAGGCLLWGVIAWTALGARTSAIDDVRAASSRLIAVQDIRVAVVEADSLAGSSYLVGGGERAADRESYLAQIARASTGLTTVAAGSTDLEAQRLASVSEMLGRYVGLVEQARANNRQGFPIGAAYQRQANTLVDNSVVGRDDDADGVADVDMVTLLQEVEQSERDRINDRMGDARRAAVWLHLVGWPLLGVMVASQVWLSRRFRRLINVPVAVGAGLLAVLLVIAGLRAGSALATVEDAVTGPLSTADQVAQLRAVGFEARSQEALVLINRGNGAAHEQAWADADATADALIASVCGSRDACDVGDAFSGYRSAHLQLVELDAGGDWDGAVASHLGDADESSLERFLRFDIEAQDRIEPALDAARERLADATSGMGAVRLGAALGAVIAAAAMVVGFGQRLREYQ